MHRTFYLFVKIILYLHIIKSNHMVNLMLCKFEEKEIINYWTLLLVHNPVKSRVNKCLGQYFFLLDDTFLRLGRHS